MSFDGARKHVLLGAVALCALLYCVQSLRLGTDLSNFMPSGEGSELATLLGELSSSQLTRTMLLSVAGPDLDSAIDAAKELAAGMREHAGFAWVRASVDEAELEDLYKLYFPRRHLFLTRHPEHEIPGLTSQRSLRERARELRTQLATPAGGALARIAPEDPLGAFAGIVERFRAGEASLKTVSGQLVTRDDQYAILIASTSESAFDSGVQTPLLNDLDAIWSAIATRGPPGLVLEMAGANRFAVAAERSIRGDVFRIAIFTSLGVAALFLTFVGSLRGFLAVSLAPLVGILTATTLGLLCFGEIDGLTMAFGGSLMGIAIDYSNHLLIHHGLEGRPASQSAYTTASRLRPSLLLGAATTIVSFLGLAITAFPAFREISFFATVGVAGALAATLFWLPDFVAAVPPPPPRAERASLWLGSLVTRLASLPRALLAAPLVLAALAALALPGLEWSDDMSKLTNFDPEVVSQDRRVRARVARADEGRFAIGIAEDDEGALALGEAIRERLAPALAVDALDAIRSLDSLLWSASLQQRNWAALTKDSALAERVDRVFSEEGFKPGAFAPFAQALAGPAPEPLTLDALRGTPLEELVAPYYFRLTGTGAGSERRAVVAHLQGLRDEALVRRALKNLPSVHVIDQKRFVNDVYREFRETTLRQMALGSALVVLLLVLRYRDVRKVAAAALPAGLVAVCVLALLAATGTPANLLHVMALTMVMGMGVDYGVFLVDTVERARRGTAGDAAAVATEVGPTMLSLLMSCLTTALVFGALAFSSQPALQAIGVTTAVGVLLSYALAPLALLAVDSFEVSEPAGSADRVGEPRP